MSNFNNVVSLPVSADLSAAADQYKLVYLSSTGLAISTAVDSASEVHIGTLLRGNTKNEDSGATYEGKAADVHLRGASGGFHYVRVGSNTAIAAGDLIEMSTVNGCVDKKASAATIGVALDASSAALSVIRAILL